MNEIPEEIVELEQCINENGYEIAGPSVTVCYNYLHTTPEGELISAMPVSGEKERYAKYCGYTEVRRNCPNMGKEVKQWLKKQK